MLLDLVGGVGWSGMPHLAGSTWGFSHGDDKAFLPRFVKELM